MEIVNRIVEWAAGQPLWQRVAVADILAGDEALDDKAVARYTDIALREVTDLEGVTKEFGNPLEEYDYTSDTSSSSVALKAISNTVNVNDIADNSGLDFGVNNLNIIFGNNAAGKSGYTRVLKSACMSRGAEPVRGSIWRGEDLNTGANITFEVDGSVSSLEWSNEAAADPHLKTIHVFDSKSGSAYLSRSTDIKYKPAGMDVLDKLSEAIQRVGAKLDDDRQSKGLQLTSLSQAFSIYEGTKAQVLVDSLEKSGAAELLNEIITISDEEEAAVEALTRDIPERERQAPARYRDSLSRAIKRLERISTLASNLRNAVKRTQQETIRESLKIKAEAIKIAVEAKKAKFDGVDFLGGTGGELWRVMWNAAESFANECAYPGHSFPQNGEGAKCPLCQQELAKDAQKRLNGFSKHVKDKSQENMAIRTGETQKLIDTFENANQSDEEVQVLFADVSAEDFSGIDKVLTAVEELRSKHSEYMTAINSGTVMVEDINFEQIDSVLEGLVQYIDKSRIELAKPLDDEKYKLELETDKKKLNGIKARKLLAIHEKAIRLNIETHVTLAAYASAHSKCNTKSVSILIGRLSNNYILAPLKTSFDQELNKIFSGRIKAELIAGSTKQAVPHSEIVLTAEGVRSREKIEGVMSEGEQRGLALAGFFTELSIMPNKSAIIFDDPITSMDDENALKIAKRLIEAAEERQVIVFTHRLSFVSQLIDEARRKNVPVETKTVRKMTHPGIVESRIPWDSMGVRERVAWLRNCLQAQLKPLQTKGEAERYESVAEHFYCKLRETWERAVEEKLFGDVVKRHSHNISTLQMRNVTYRETDDAVVYENMSKCSNYMHDGTGDSTEPIPLVGIIEQDLKSLEDWLNELKGRRPK